MKVYPVYYNDSHSERAPKCICTTEARAKQECDRLILEYVADLKRKTPADTHAAIERNALRDRPYYYEEVELLY